MYEIIARHKENLYPGAFVEIQTMGKIFACHALKKGLLIMNVTFLVFNFLVLETIYKLSASRFFKSFPYDP